MCGFMCCDDNKREGAGKRSWITRRVNTLQREYDAATTAGVKAGLRRKMNKILKGE